MKTISQIKRNAILIIAIICIITLKVNGSNNGFRPKSYLENNHNIDFVSILDKDLNSSKVEIINTKDSESNIRINYENITIGVEVQKTYFIPGAGFHHKDKRTIKNFTNELIDTFNVVLKEDFTLITKSPKKIPIKPLRSGFNGKWAIMNGYKPINYQKHKNVLRTVKEIESDVLLSNNVTPNIIGSSYGSVIAAQSVIALLERDNNIDKIGLLVIAASMIDVNSELGVRLEELKSNGKIEKIYYYPNPNDNIIACSGTSKKEARQGFKKVVFQATPSIVNMKKHEHNIAALDSKRAHHILEVLIQQSKIKWVEHSENLSTSNP